jgi:hypothetical protein
MFKNTYMYIAIRAKTFIEGSRYSKIIFLLFNAKYVDAAIIDSSIACVNI